MVRRNCERRQCLAVRAWCIEMYDTESNVHGKFISIFASSFRQDACYFRSCKLTFSLRRRLWHHFAFAALRRSIVKFLTLDGFSVVFCYLRGADNEFVSRLHSLCPSESLSVRSCETAKKSHRDEMRCFLERRHLVRRNDHFYLADNPHSHFWQK